MSIIPSATSKSARQDDPQKEAGEHEFEISKLKTEIGWIGKVIGAGDEKAGNIAFVMIAFCAIALILKDNPSTSLISIITLALGYLFGKKS